MQITWDSVEQLEDYTSRLRAAAERLTAENRRLRRCHADLVVKVGGVMSVDLLRQPQRWKDMLMEIRHMMAALVQVRERDTHTYMFYMKMIARNTLTPQACSFHKVLKFPSPGILHRLLC